MVLSFNMLKTTAIHALHALLILRNNYWRKWGQEVGTQRKHPFRHTKRGVYALEKKLISIITHHLLVRHAPSVVYRIISFVNLPILSVTTSGFHHCDARILCRNTHSSSRNDYVTILILYKESKNKILATLDAWIDCNATKDERYLPHMSLQSAMLSGCSQSSYAYNKSNIIKFNA